MTVETPQASTPGDISSAVDVRPLFLGPKAENREFFEQTVAALIDEHVHWRRDFHPTDASIVSPAQMREPGYEAVIDRTTEVLEELTSRLKSTSTPWFSTRYLGHMNSDTLMVSNLAEIATMLYNPNNVSYESSVATSRMETEVGKDFATLMGYQIDRAWGHITADGTIANDEALWLARNLKSLPLAIREVLPDLVAGKVDWELLNMSTEDALDLLDVVKQDPQHLATVLAATSRGSGVGRGSLGKVLVPSTRHYSWDKATDLLGIGVDNLVKVPVDGRYRMDLVALQHIIDDLVASHMPILMLVAVVGTTEEGAVDDVAGLRNLIARNRAAGINFAFHIDAAYGGYARTLFLDEDRAFMPYAELQARLSDEGLTSSRPWPSPAVWSAYEAMPVADSITVDPHKMGYVPYAAGGVVFKDKRILALIAYAAAYVFEDPDNLDTSLGSVVLEGSKSGATAAGVWSAHQLLPLTHNGYGQLIGRSWSGARTFVEVPQSVEHLAVAGHRIICEPLIADPDFNIVCMAFNIEGNTDLERMNALNAELYHRFSYEFGPLYQDDWITSHTELTHETYGDVPSAMVGRLGIPAEEWTRIGRLQVLRSCVMHPWIAHHRDYPEHWQSFLAIVSAQLEDILMTSGADYTNVVAQSAPGH
jgi:tyrosine decarboxylase